MPGNNNYRIKGAFFENENPSGPAFTGFVEIDGVKTFIALWPKTSPKTGVNYFQCSEDKKKNQAQGGQAPAPMAPRSPFNRPSARPALQKKTDPFDDGDDGDQIPF